MIYIDFDGVILDTEDVLFYDWRQNTDHKLLPTSEKIKYIQDIDWDYVLYNSLVIDNSIDYLKEMDPKKSFILTKVHSLDNEAEKKIKWLRLKGVKQSVIVVPYNLKKIDMVDPFGHILVDDSLKNLREWKSMGGKPIFFDINEDNIDPWEMCNIDNFKRIKSLSKIKTR